MVSPRRGLLVAAAVAAGQAAHVADAAAPDDPRRLIVRSLGREAAATIGANCFPNPDGTGGTCVEAVYPLKTSGAVRIRPAGQVTLLTGAPATEVWWRLSRRSRSSGREAQVAYGPTVARGSTGRRWVASMPRPLRRSATILGVFVRYANGYADFEARVRVAARRGA